ncbi:flagellar brake domain-containing protein [Idiomarina abyssalis]|uniref:Flagellar brake protein n=1 Tax=Idiomarina abyssalis TaxID=86102 RepID=A0A8I1G8L7_9GAMM|nr:flagellar brake protein [Idiomarina abyssalis]KPD21178.1 glycosyltransferase [Idiomarina abyssalis]MBJ7265673.1 flagellar brake protein [Idiomarina abyssalis]MBJ7273857.1 flagellar brake protein [Idiomarina abyssalis]MBJ7314437.1 flagellar brake protein [Idiomarina abyssalis]SFT73587.1 PilZ domain-containing protein [Idiomarina abyssalis]
MEKQVPTLDSSSQPQLKLTYLRPGDMIDVEFAAATKVRTKLQLVGFDTGNYLLLKQPNPRTDGSYADVLFEGNPVIVRLVLEGETGECIAFKTNIRAVSNIPFRLLYLDYPKQVENRALRAQKRVRTHIPVDVTADNSQTDSRKKLASGVVVDISSAGCRILFKAQSEGSNVTHMNIKISIGSGSQKDLLTLSGQIMNQRKERGMISVGVRFTDDEAHINNVFDHLLIDTEFEC